MFLTILLLASSLRAALPSEVQAAFAMGDCDTVHALLPGLLLTPADQPPTDDEEIALLLAARCAVQRRQPAEALNWMSRLPESDELSPWVRWVTAQALMVTDAPEVLPLKAQAASAIEQLDHLTLPPSLGVDLRLLRDRALVAAGRGTEARADLQSLLSTRAAPEARYWLAWNAERQGDLSGAVRTYNATWVHHAASSWADLAAVRLSVLHHPVPDLGTAVGRGAALTRVGNLEDASRNKEAVTLLFALEAAGGPDESKAPPDTPSWHRKVAMTCFRAHDYPCAVDRFLRAGSPNAPEVPGGADTIFNHALALSRTGDYDASLATYQVLIQRFPDHAKADFASYKIGYVAFDRKQYEEAIEALHAHQKRYPNSGYMDETLWFSGWSAFMLGRPSETILTLRSLVQLRPNSSLVPPARYWIARLSPVAERSDALNSFIGLFPRSGGAWFAAASLGQSPPRQSAKAPPLPPLGPEITTPHPEAVLADRFLAAGLDDWAAALLLPLDDLAHTSSTAVRLALARRLVAAGQVEAGRRMWGEGCNHIRTADLREVCLPRPHAEVVEAMIGDSGLDPYLPYAIMTAESAMDPNATSPVGARGLMQLMPEVAQGLHMELWPNRRFDPDNLYRSAYNAGLGTAELGRLYRHYQESGGQDPIPLVAAAYNGGADAVDRWLAEAPRPVELDVFAENIGYTETRQYVRRVLGYLRGYQVQYGKEY